MVRKDKQRDGQKDGQKGKQRDGQKDKQRKEQTERHTRMLPLSQYSHKTHRLGGPIHTGLQKERQCQRSDG